MRTCATEDEQAHTRPAISGQQCYKQFNEVMPHLSIHQFVRYGMYTCHYESCGAALCMLGVATHETAQPHGRCTACTRNSHSPSLPYAPAANTRVSPRSD